MADLENIKDVAGKIVEEQKSKKDKEVYKKAYNLLLMRLAKQDSFGDLGKSDEW